MLKLSLNDSDARVVAALQLKNAKLINACVQKMTYLMTRLQQRVVTQKLSGQVLKRRTGTLANSISNPRATAEGTNIVGKLDWAGGVAWYGRLHEFGGSKSYVIYPIHTKAQARAYARGTTQSLGVLKFAGGGQERYATYVFHPPAQAKHYMTNSLDEMKDEIKRGLQEAILGVLGRS